MLMFTMPRLNKFFVFSQFVSHANCQQLLASIWYEGLPGFRRKNMALQSLEIFRIGKMTFRRCRPWQGFSIIQSLQGLQIFSFNHICNFHFHRNPVSHFLRVLYSRSTLVYWPNNEKAIYQIYLSQCIVFHIFM